MNKWKRLFCPLLCVALLLQMTVVGQAASLSIQRQDKNGLEVAAVGTLSSSYWNVGQYTVKVVKVNSDNTLRLHLSGGIGNNAVDITYTSLTLNDSTVTLPNRGLNVTTLDNAWDEDDSVTFVISDGGSNTSVSSTNNTVLVSTGLSGSTKITRNRLLSPQFKVVDYNVNDADVDGKASLSGYNSNDSFPLATDNGREVKVEKTTATEGMATFLVTIPVRYTGRGNSMSFALAYKTKDGTNHALECYAVLPNVEEYVDNDDDDDDDEDELDPLTPFIIVDSYSYGGTSVTAGEDFTLHLRLRNTSSTHALKNIVMSVSPMGVFSMTSSSNTFFIETLRAGSVMERTVTLKAGLTKVTDDEDANSIDIKFTYQYVDTNKNVLLSGNSNESITLPVDFPDRFELGIVSTDTEAYMGEECSVSLPMVNKGRSSVYNLSAFVRGTMRNAGETQFIGNLAAGTENSADFSVIYDEEGTFEGEIVVTYEDANMNPKELVAPFKVTVIDPMAGMEDFEDPFGPGGMIPEEPVVPVDTEPKPDPTLPAKIVLGLLVGGMCAYTTIQKAKAKRSIYLDEDL